MRHPGFFYLLAGMLTEIRCVRARMLFPLTGSGRFFVVIIYSKVLTYAIWIIRRQGSPRVFGHE